MNRKAKRQQARAQRRQMRKHRAAAGERGASLQASRTASRSLDQRADKLALVESFDNLAGLRRGLGKVAALRDEWAGIPMPLDGERLVIEPKYRNGAGLAKIGAPAEEPLPDDVKSRNHWWSDRLRCEVHIWEEGGKICHGFVSGVHHFGMDLSTLGCSDAWGIEQESNAVQMLAGLVRHRQMKQYLLTGMFLETSKRSGVTYMFRRLKPTVAIDARDNGKSARVLCTLCLHPIGYYQGTWAGAMTPTDDVVAHLMMMRGDEVMLWRRANQCDPARPEAGL